MPEKEESDLGPSYCEAILLSKKIISYCEVVINKRKKYFILDYVVGKWGCKDVSHHCWHHSGGPVVVAIMDG